MTADWRSHSPDLDNLSGLLIVPTSLFVSAWVGYTTYECFVANLASLEFYQLGPTAKLLSAACGIASFVVVGWLLLNGMWIHGSFGSMSSTLGVVSLVIVGNLLVTTACAWCLTRAAPKLPGEPWYVSLHHPTVNVAHDGVLAGYFLLCFGIVQYMLLALAPRTSNTMPEFLLEIAPSASIVAVFLGYAKLMRAISLEHVQSEKTRHSDVMRQRSRLPLDETRQLWVERAEALGIRYDRKLNWSLLVSLVGLGPESWRVATSLYTDPTTEVQRVSRLMTPVLVMAKRTHRRDDSHASDDDSATSEAQAQTRHEQGSHSDWDVGSYPG